MSASPPTIVRSWSARATPAGADAYVRHFEDAVLPTLQALDGHRGVLVLRRADDTEVEIVVLTLWTSIDAIHEFSGSDASLAVVEPEARAVLTSFDARVTHFDLVLQTGT